MLPKSPNEWGLPAGDGQLADRPARLIARNSFSSSSARDAR